MCKGKLTSVLTGQIVPSFQPYMQTKESHNTSGVSLMVQAEETLEATYGTDDIPIEEKRLPDKRELAKVIIRQARECYNWDTGPTGLLVHEIIQCHS